MYLEMLDSKQKRKLYVKTQSNANPLIRNPNPGEGQHPGPDPRSKEGTSLSHHISVATVTNIPCSAENAREGRMSRHAADGSKRHQRI